MQLSHYHLLKRLISPHWIVLAPLLKINWSYQSVFICRLNFVLLVYTSILIMIPQFWLLYLWISFEIRSESSNLVLFQDCFDYLISFKIFGLQYEFKNFSFLFFFSVKRVVGILIELFWICRSLWVILPSYNIKYRLLSSYINFLKFLSTVSFNFHCISLSLLWLDVFIGILFFWMSL